MKLFAITVPEGNSVPEGIYCFIKYTECLNRQTVDSFTTMNDKYLNIFRTKCLKLNPANPLF